MQVASNGDLANWSTGEADAIPAVGGAMDLVAGVKSVLVMTEHTTRDGRPKLLRACTYPLTGVGVVSRLYTNLAVINITPAGFVVREMAPGLTADQLQRWTDAPLNFAPTPTCQGT
jgi:3-oxoadipate CoA-transferase beta subunit